MQHSLEIMRPKSWDWFIGLFEGEGTIYYCNQGKAAKAKIASTDKDVLEFAQAIAGGKLYGPYRWAYFKPHHKDVYELKWFAKDTQELMGILYFDLCEHRKKQIDKTLEKVRNK